jgi:hypothetical protein
LTVDTKKPLAVNEIGFGHESFGVEFSEKIDCSSQEITVVKRGEGCDIAGEPRELSPEVLRATFEFQCVNDDASASRWVVVFPGDQVGRYVVRVRGVRDASGNVADDFQIDAVTNSKSCSSSSLGGVRDAPPTALGSLGRRREEREAQIRTRRLFSNKLAFVAAAVVGVVLTTLVGVSVTRGIFGRGVYTPLQGGDEKMHLVNHRKQSSSSSSSASYKYGATL